MTDVPPGAGRPGDDAGPFEPSGARRSSFTPPEAPATPPVDDDALADALAAQVSAFAPPPPSTAAVTPTTPGQTAAEPATEPVTERSPFAPPVPDAAGVNDPGLPAAWGAPAAPEWAAPEPTAAEPSAPGRGDDMPTDDPFAALGAASTLEAIERLESELRRRAEARATADGTPLPEAFATPASASPPEPVVVPPESAPFAPPPVEPPPADVWVPPIESFEAPVPRWEIPVIDEPPVFEIPVPPVAPAPIPEEPDSVVSEPVAVEPFVVEPVAVEPVVVEPLAPALPDPPTWAPSVPVADAPVVASPVASPPPLVEPPTWPGQGSPVTGPVDLPPPMTAPVDLPPPPGAGPIDLPPPATADAELVAPAVAAPAADPFAAIFGSPAADPRGAAGQIVDADIVDAEILDDDAAPGRTDGDAEWSLSDLDLAAPPSAPIKTATVVADDEVPELVTAVHPAFSVERAGPEPTLLDLRAGRAARLFWLNFAATSSVLGVAVGALVLGVGASPRQALVAVLIGVALSFLPLGFVTLAAARSGQPPMIVSRAVFGIVGNGIPAVLALVSRVYWGGALLWALATGVGAILTDAGLDAGLGESVWALIALGVAGLLALVIAVVGYGLLARVQLVASILAGLLVVGVIVLTAPALDLAAAQQIPDGSWVGTLVAGAVLVFSVLGLAWVHSAGDLARYQRPDSDGGAGMLMATLGATLPPLVLAGWGVLLAASDSRIAEGLARDPLYTIAALLPIWYPAPLLAALAVGLLSGVTLTIYSAGFALQSLGLPIRRPLATLLGGVLVLGAGAVLVALVPDAGALLRDVATTVGVPVAAWAGIFAADLMLRRRRFHGPSLLRLGGVYPAVRVVNLLILVAATAVGFGLSTAELPGLTWQGYLWPVLGLDDPVLLASDAGVVVAIGMALLMALAAGLPAIRRQERAEVGADVGGEAAPRADS